MVELSAEDKLIKARIELLREKPFFAFLANHLTFIEKKDLETCGIDIKGNFYYNPAFVSKLSKEECKGVVCHEVMHCALSHLERLRGKDTRLWNVSGDTVINNILITDNIILPKNCILPNYNEITLFGIKVEEIEKKCAEEVYDELYKNLRKKELKDLQNYLKNHADSNKGFDVHIYPQKGYGEGNKEEGNSISGKLKEKSGKDWNKIMVDACTFARNQGTLPAGMERILGDLLKTELDWRSLLYKYISNQIPIDYTWARPSKKSFSTGIYIPSITRESLDLVIAIDTSGSIRNEELNEFFSEILGIVNSFSNVNITLIDCDCEIQSVNTYQRISMDDIQNIKLKGGSGTSHIPVYEYVEKNIPNTKLLINFTDGYTSFPKSSPIQSLWVIAGRQKQKEDIVPFGDVVYLKGNDNERN